MRDKIIITKMSVALLALSLLVMPTASYADWNHRDDHHFYHYADHPHFGWRVSDLPHGYFSLWIGGARYYYYDGLYYNYVGGEYVIVTPPAGAVVTSIPSDFQPVVVNGLTYYVNNGTYYLYTPQGYQVTASPVSAAVVQPTILPAAVSAQDAFTVNIPNNKGNYTPVVIKKSGNGYVGPQGEFYSDFPKVAQLKVMYGK